MNKLFILIFLSGIATFSAAQTVLTSKNKRAIELYTQADNYRVRMQFAQALGMLNEAIEKDRKFVEAYYRRGLVYHNMRAYPKAIADYEKALSLTSDPRIQKVIWFDLGDAYLSTGDYEKARDVLTSFLKVETVNRRKIDRAQQVLKNAEFAIENRNVNGDYRQRALSDTVNRFVMQYFPVLTADQKELIFTRRIGHRDINDEDLMISRKNEKGSWTEPTSISPSINSTMNEGTCTISADGRRLIFTSCEDGGSCDLFESQKVGDEWSKPKNLGPNVNSPAWESQPSLSADGRTLYFVSERRAGLGQKDIWVSSLDGGGKWTKAINVGRPINSEYDEMSPFIHNNNRTLFYATNALPGFGGYDIFYSERDSSGWSTPQNIGPPINNNNDQYALFITADGKKGYYAHEETREDGRGFSKIYEVDVPDGKWLKYRSNYVTGVVRDFQTKLPLSAKVELIDLKRDQRESLVESDSLSGKYLMVLTQGSEYGLYVTKPGYLFKSLNFNYSDVTNFEPVTVDVELQRIRTGSSVVLNNLFFDVDKHDLKDRSISELNKVLRFLNDNPDVRIEISGHTDNTGTRQYNLELSQKRANAVFDFLVENGISPKRVISKGYGPDRPVMDNSTEQGKKFNRRIEFAIVK
jgi:OmpA-OmpF porin, OOP family